MSSTDTPADQNSSERPVGRASDSGPTSDAAEAVIAALDDADVALDASDLALDSDEDAVTLLPDSEGKGRDPVLVRYAYRPQ